MSLVYWSFILLLSHLAVCAMIDAMTVVVAVVVIVVSYFINEFPIGENIPHVSEKQPLSVCAFNLMYI